MGLLVDEEKLVQKENNAVRENRKRTDFIKDLKRKKKNKKLFFIFSIGILTIASIITIININKSGTYPWGSDTFAHLFKSNILYDAFKEGKIFSNFNSNWYNGVQLFRYNEPIPYYLLASINIFTKNIFLTFNVFIVFVFIIGGTGFLLWGYYSERQKLGLFLGIIWFFIPNNLRILFSEGNLPLVIVNMIVPYLLLIYYKAIKENRVINYLLLSIVMAIITLTNTSLAIMILLLIFALNIVGAIRNKAILKNVILLAISSLGVMLTSFWLLPAIQGGLLNMSSNEIAQVMERSTYNLIDSLNPFLRFSNIEVFYFGLSFALISVFGMLFSNKENKLRQGFFISTAILLGTSSVLLPFFKEMPLNKFMFISKIVPIAIAFVFVAILLWRDLRKSILLFFCFAIALDSMMSFEGLGNNREFPKELGRSIEVASDMAVQRIGILDASKYGSFPSYYISYINKESVKKQVFGWAWQGAETSSNIVNINTALENNYFGTMFDRSLELGADTLVIKKSFIKDFNDLDYWANKIGYEKKYEDENDIIYKYPVDYEFGTKIKYDGLAIGEYSSNIIYNFPDFTVGESIYIDDYSIENLKEYKSIFLSGFKYKNKNKAEDIVKEASKEGIKVCIDITGMDSKGFLGISPQSIDLRKNYGEIYYKGEKIKLKDFPEDLYNFRCNYITGTKEENKENYTVSETKVLPYISDYNENLVFLGLNIPYYATMTKDKTAINILEDSLGMKADILPNRRVVGVDIDFDSDENIEINSEEEDVVTSLASLDTFKNVEGSFSSFNHLVKVEDKEVKINIGYPNLWIGNAISVISLIILLILIRSTQIGKVKTIVKNKGGRS